MDLQLIMPTKILLNLKIGESKNYTLYKYELRFRSSKYNGTFNDLIFNRASTIKKLFREDVMHQSTILGSLLKFYN